MDGADKKSKRYIPLPVSSSLPDHISSDFVLARINATSSSTAQKIDNSKKLSNESETLADDKKQIDNEQDISDKKEDKNDAVDPEKELAIVREETATKSSSKEINFSSSKQKLFGVQTTHLTDEHPDLEQPLNHKSSFEPKVIQKLKLIN